MNYSEFIGLPEIANVFNSMYSEQKEYFRKKCSVSGFDKEHLEAVSIKIAILSTDFYLTEIYRKNSEIKKGG